MYQMAHILHVSDGREPLTSGGDGPRSCPLFVERARSHEKREREIEVCYMAHVLMYYSEYT
jgi:hypothetical protein